jgi:hypothetical protein
VRAGHGEQRSAAECPEPTTFAEACSGRIDHSPYKLTEGQTIHNITGRMIATSCPIIILSMSADLLISPTDTRKFD